MTISLNGSPDVWGWAVGPRFKPARRKEMHENLKSEG